MDPESITISPITDQMMRVPGDTRSIVLWIQKTVSSLEINSHLLENISNTILFLMPNAQWKIDNGGLGGSVGYALYLSRETLNHPMLRNLHIQEVRLFSNGEIPTIHLAPGIEKRTHALLEMLDELIGSHLNHKDDAIISLLNAFFVYCDGQCNIKSVITEDNTKKSLVYKFKKMVDKHLGQYQKVEEFAQLLNVSPSYLNEAVQETLSTNTKALIDEQLVMRARHKLKFSDKSVKEISFELGFSTPDYFSYFFKKHTGTTPSSLRG